MALGPIGLRREGRMVMSLPAGTDCGAEVTHSRKRGTGGKVTVSARCAKALTGAVPRRRFGYFAAVGKVTPYPLVF